MIDPSIRRHAGRWQARLLVSGVVALAMAAWLAHGKVSMLRDATRVDGVVVDLLASASDEPTYRAVIRYTDATGEHTEPMGPSTDPPLWSLDEHVGVWIAPGPPRRVVVDGFLVMWGWTTAFAACGLLLSTLGIHGWLSSTIAVRRREWLRREGKPVTALLLEIESGLPVVARQPSRRIVVTWADASGTVHEARSDALSFDPTPWAKDRGGFTVFVDPRDPRRHWVDVTFLPQFSNASADAGTR